MLKWIIKKWNRIVGNGLDSSAQSRGKWQALAKMVMGASGSVKCGAILVYIRGTVNFSGRGQLHGVSKYCTC